MMDPKKLATTEYYQHRFRNFSTMIIIPSTILFLGLLLFLIFARREVTVLTAAEIEPVKAAVTVQATAANRIVSNRMKEGKRVKKGETLLVYHDVANPTQIKLLKQQLATLKEQQQQLDVLKQSVTENKDLFSKADRFGYQQQVQDYLSQRRVLTLTAEAEQATQTVASEKNKEIDRLLSASIQTSQAKMAAISEAKAAIQANKPLASRHAYHYLYQQYESEMKNTDAEAQANLKRQYLAQLQTQLDEEQTNLTSLEQQRAGQKQADVSAQKAGETQANLTALQSRLQQTAVAEQTKVEQQIQADEAKLATLNDETQNYHVKASAGGVLHLETALAGNQYVPSGSVLARILPDLTEQTAADIKLGVSPTEIMSIKRGQKVRLRIAENVPTPTILDGRVYAIDVAPTRDPKVGNFFTVKARVKLSKSQRQSLYYGLAGQASVITGTKTYWDYFADKMFNHR